MKLEQLISNLRKITPRAEYAERSRSEIIGSAPLRLTPPSFRQVVFQSFQFVSAVALSVVLLLLIGGGFSSGPRIMPSPLAGLDALGIQAEAQAVDIQIRLTDVGYMEPQAESSPAAAVRLKRSAPKSSLEAALGASTSTPKNLDDALEALME